MEVGVKGVAWGWFDAGSVGEVELVSTVYATDSIEVGGTSTANGVVFEGDYLSSGCQHIADVVGSGHPSRVSEQEGQSVVMRVGAVFEVGVEDHSRIASQAFAAADVPEFWLGAFDAESGVPVGGSGGTGGNSNGGRRKSFGSSEHPVGARSGEVGEVWDDNADMPDDVYLLSTGAGLTPGQLHVEDIVDAGALNALSAVVEWNIDGTVVDTGVQLTSLEVLVDQVDDGLPAQDPVVGVEVGLEDCWLQEGGRVALCCQDIVHLVDYQLLLGDLQLDLGQDLIGG